MPGKYSTSWTIFPALSLFLQQRLVEYLLHIRYFAGYLEYRLVEVKYLCPVRLYMESRWLVLIVNLTASAIIWKLDPCVCLCGIFLIELVEVRGSAHCDGTIPCWGSWTTVSGEWVLSCTFCLSVPAASWLWLLLRSPVPSFSLYKGLYASTLKQNNFFLL